MSPSCQILRGRGHFSGAGGAILALHLLAGDGGIRVEITSLNHRIVCKPRPV
jgi:hypothetical protein